MKTPMQELFEFMEQNQYFIGNDLFDKYQELLEKEKEVIMNAYVEANSKNSYPFVEWDPFPKESAENYYNETFNTKE